MRIMFFCVDMFWIVCVNLLILVWFGVCWRFVVGGVCSIGMVFRVCIWCMKFVIDDVKFVVLMIGFSYCVV